MPDEKRTQHATLGCGTLILIALIVLFFGRPGIQDLERDVKSLRSEVGDLKKAVESQTNEIRRLTDKVNQRPPGKAEQEKGKQNVGGNVGGFYANYNRSGLASTKVSGWVQRHLESNRHHLLAVNLLPIGTDDAEYLAKYLNGKIAPIQPV